MLKDKFKTNLKTPHRRNERFNGGEDLTAEALVCETFEFLNKYYRGCFALNSAPVAERCVYISPAKYADFMKTVLKTVFGRETVTISVLPRINSFSIAIEFETSILSEEDVDMLERLAADSGFSFEVADDRLSLDIAYSDEKHSIFNAISTRIIYNSLQKSFIH